MLETVCLYFSESALWALGISGFLSATLLPGASEAILISTLATQQHHVAAVVAVATLGNTLGGLTNYWLGLLIPNRTEQGKYGHKAIVWLNKYGYAVLLFSWLPVIGDPLCLAAGWLRMRLLPCLLLIALGKAARYSIIAMLFLGIF